MLESVRKFIYQNATKYKTLIKWIFASVVALTVLFFYESGFLKRIELTTIDYRFLLKSAKARYSDAVFIDMAEDSIKSIGSWPWPRRWHATIASILSEYGAKAIAFDVIFSEPQDEFDDRVFEEALQKAKTVYLPLLYNLDTQDYTYISRGGGIVSVLEPIPAFRKFLKGTGHINAIPDSDGTLRRVPPVITYNNATTYQFGLKIGSDILGLKEGAITFNPEKHQLILQKPEGGSLKVPLDEDNQLIINWQGKWGRAFRHYSYMDVITSYALLKEGKKPIIDLNIFKGKVCIIGLTALGLMDIKPVPIENAYPAVGINGMVIANLLNNDFVYDAPKKVDILLLILISIAITFSLFGLRPLNGIVFTGAAVFIYIAVSIALFYVFNLLILVFYPLVAIFLSYGLTASYTQLLSAIERAQLFTQATRDGLTRLYNVRHFKLLLEAEFKNVSTYKTRHLSLIMIDLDNFKRINDTYGHQAGDAILRETAGIVESKCRKMDIVARYGGEEFIIMLIGAGQKDAIDVAEKIRKAIENKKFIFRDQEYYGTLSLGIVEYSAEKAKEELIEKADKALYKAKRDGKNRAYIYDPSMR